MTESVFGFQYPFGQIFDTFIEEKVELFKIRGH